jgi:hypothetical protein
MTLAGRTSAVKRYPRRGTVAIGPSAPNSPLSIALRSAEMLLAIVPSSTITSGHTRARSCSFVTTRPDSSTSSRRISAALGVSGTNSVPL